MYTINLRTNEDLYTGALSLLFLYALFLIAGRSIRELCLLDRLESLKATISAFKTRTTRISNVLYFNFGTKFCFINLEKHNKGLLFQNKSNFNFKHGF